MDRRDMASRTNSVENPIVKQILDIMFLDIKEKGEIDSEIVSKLEDLAKIGGLKKASLVAQSLKNISRET